MELIAAPKDAILLRCNGNIILSRMLTEWRTLRALTSKKCEHACKGAHTLFTSLREREKKKRERDVEYGYFLFLKGMTDALAPFSDLV